MVEKGFNSLIMRLCLLTLFTISCIIFLLGCDNKSNEVLAEVFPNYENYEYQKKYFNSSQWVQPHTILYRGKMNKDDYEKVISNPSYIENCIEFKGQYESMQEYGYPFKISEVDWWQAIYNKKSDFVGHYDHSLKKFTDCETSREYRYAFAYKEGFCYLIIDNTLSKDLND